MNKGASRIVVAMYTTAESWRGAGISFINIARGLEVNGYRVHLIATSDEVANEFMRVGLDVSRLPSERTLQAFGLRRRLSELHAALVIVDRAHDLRVATRAVLGNRVGIINRYNLFRESVPNDLLSRVAYAGCVKQVVFLSHGQRERVLSAAPFMRGTPATTIHEGVDPGLFSPDSRAGEMFRRTYGIPGPFMLAVGALTAEKRYDFMLESLAMLEDEVPLVICGEGEEQERLRARAAASRINVHFLGRIPHDRLPGAYNASSGLIHAGCAETFGLAVLEAMACGKPVVACAGGALPELIGTDGGAGILVPSHSESEMANAIRCVIAEPGEAAATGARARERAMTFSLDAMQKAYARVVARHVRGGDV